MAGVAGGIGCVGSGGEVDHGALWSGAHLEEQEARAAPCFAWGDPLCARAPFVDYHPGLVCPGGRRREEGVLEQGRES